MAIVDPGPGQGDVPVNAVAQGNPPQAQGPQGGSAPGGGATMALIQGISDDMVQLLDLFQNAGLPEQALRDLSGVLQNYQSVVVNAIKGGGQGQPARPERVDQGQNPVSPEAGAAAVRPSM